MIRIIYKRKIYIAMRGKKYGEIKTLRDLSKINNKIRAEMGRARSRKNLTELKKRSDYLCTLSYAPGWKKHFGSKIKSYRNKALQENRKTVKKANLIVKRKKWGSQYHPWGS